MARPRVRKDPKRGTWIVEYYDEDKRQHRLKGFKTRRGADARAEEIGGEVRKGVHVPDSKSGIVADACRVWLQRAGDERLEQETIRQYKNHVNLHLLPLTDSGERPAWAGKLGDLKLSRLTTPVANAVQRELSKRLSPSMARKVFASLKAILDEAANHKLVAFNAARGVKMRRRKRGERKVHAGVDFPCTEELAAVIVIIEGRWRPVIIILAFCGLRASELRGLEWDDVLGLNTEFPQIRVRQRADVEGEIGDTKSDSAHRYIPLTPMAADELRAWKKVCPPDRETAKLRFVFPNGNGIVENHANLSIGAGRSGKKRRALRWCAATRMAKSSKTRTASRS